MSIKQKLYKYIISGVSKGNLNLKDAVDDFVDMWDDDPRDFSDMWKRPMSWEDHLIIENTRHVIEELAPADFLLLDNIGNSTMSEPVKARFADFIWRKVGGDIVDDMVKTEMDIIDKKGKTVEQLENEYLWNDIYVGFPDNHEEVKERVRLINDAKKNGRHHIYKESTINKMYKDIPPDEAERMQW
jgi:hypothetical protein